MFLLRSDKMAGGVIIMIYNDTEDLTGTMGGESKFVRLISLWLLSDAKTQAVVLAEALRLSALLASVRAGSIEMCPACPLRRPSGPLTSGGAELQEGSRTVCHQVGIRALPQELQA